jgi:hypothetical protein
MFGDTPWAENGCGDGLIVGQHRNRDFGLTGSLGD